MHAPMWTGRERGGPICGVQAAHRGSVRHSQPQYGLITRILTRMGQSPWDDINIPGPQWDTRYQISCQMGHSAFTFSLFCCSKINLLIVYHFVLVSQKKV